MTPGCRVKQVKVWSLIREGSVYSTSIYLGSLVMVYQVELHALEHAAQWMGQNLSQKHITIFRDSQASLMASDNPIVESAAVKATVESLQYASHENQLHLAYVAVHVRHRGNEKADELAKHWADGYGIDHPQYHFNRRVILKA